MHRRRNSEDPATPIHAGKFSNWQSYRGEHNYKVRNCIMALKRKKAPTQLKGKTTALLPLNNIINPVAFLLEASSWGQGGQTFRQDFRQNHQVLRFSNRLLGPESASAASPVNLIFKKVPQQ